ncbi:uncharacterized protein EDB91DRAFT_1081414 [Suillus paluster]|uniref:uncharacterized protein n=1 Tax=Suillus paluster TaxID=48578 RepID=UPI001B87DDB5|nr:uncharacterized protein EDB91DRAFT_1081414 [Suillus paluster]KAG1742792.1 hypothetical protein EDB91DRAFT_1081414 [Suillus paluster]
MISLAQEVLDTILWTYHTKKLKLDNSYFPEYKMLMLRLQLYGIFSKGNSMHKERVCEAAAKLLKTSEYLQLPDSSEVRVWVQSVIQKSLLTHLNPSQVQGLYVLAWGLGKLMEKQAQCW